MASAGAINIHILWIRVPIRYLEDRYISYIEYEYDICPGVIISSPLCDLTRVLSMSRSGAAEATAKAQHHDTAPSFNSTLPRSQMRGCLAESEYRVLFLSLLGLWLSVFPAFSCPRQYKNAHLGPQPIPHQLGRCIKLEAANQSV